MNHKLLRTFTITLSFVFAVVLGGSGHTPRVTAARATCAPLAFFAVSLPNATLQRTYTATLAGTGGAGPYLFSLQGGTLPPGLSFDDGVFSGTPTQTGTFTLTIQAEDSNGCKGTEAITLRVQNAPSLTPAGPLPIIQGSTLTGVTLATVSDVETAAGNLVVTPNVIPAGLTLTHLTNTNGTIKATLAAACDATLNANLLTLSVSDGDATTSTNVTVNVAGNTPPAVGTYANAAVTAFETLSHTPSTPLSDNGSIANLSVQVQGNFLGNMLADATGKVTISNAHPAGSYTVTVTATDNCQASTQRSFTLTVNKATPVITWYPPAPLGAGVPLSSTQLNATANVEGSFVYTPPAGMRFNVGTYPLTTNFTPSDAVNYHLTSHAVSLTVANPCGIDVRPLTMPTATRGVPFVQTLSGTPTASYVFSLASGTLPPGMTLVNTLGIYSLRGTPQSTATPGAYTFIIKARQNATGCEGLRVYTLTLQ